MRTVGAQLLQHTYRSHYTTWIVGETGAMVWWFTGTRLRIALSPHARRYLARKERKPRQAGLTERQKYERDQRRT